MFFSEISICSDGVTLMIPLLIRSSRPSINSESGITSIDHHFALFLTQSGTFGPKTVKEIVPASSPLWESLMRYFPVREFSLIENIAL